MRKTFVIIACLIVVCSSVMAQLSDKGMKEFIELFEKDFKLNDVAERVRKGDIEASRLQIIYLILANTPEVCIHNMSGASGNRVYVQLDGHREFVYDKHGNLVADGINNGSYNYFSRREKPLKHFFFDIHPWIIWGNSARDTTLKEERISAYMCDLGTGIRAALDQKEILPTIQKDRWDEQGQLQTLALFVFALEKSKAASLYNLFAPDHSSVHDREIIEVLKELEVVFNKMY